MNFGITGKTSPSFRSTKISNTQQNQLAPKTALKLKTLEKDTCSFKGYTPDYLCPLSDYDFDMVIRDVISPLKEPYENAGSEWVNKILNGFFK